MADGGISRFAPQNKSTHERLSTSTIGLVALSDFRKRRAQVLEQEEREARSGPSTPSRSRAGSPDKEASGGPGSAEDKQREEERRLKRLKKKGGLLRRKQLLSFGDDDDDSSEASIGDKIKDVGAAAATSTTATTPTAATAATLEEDSPVVDNAPPRAKLKANAAVPVAPRAMTKAALLQEATEREALRREFLAVQEAVKESEIVIPFVFYDGTNIPGGVVRLRKGDFVWYFLDRSRKVGAELRSGRQARSRRAWARIGVDDLLLVRDTIIIPHVSLANSSSPTPSSTPPLDRLEGDTALRRRLVLMLLPPASFQSTTTSTSSP